MSIIHKAMFSLLCTTSMITIEQEDLEIPLHEEILPPPPIAIAPEPPPNVVAPTNLWTPKEWQNWTFAGGAAVMAVAGIILVMINQGQDSPTPVE